MVLDEAAGGRDVRDAHQADQPEAWLLGTCCGPWPGTAEGMDVWIRWRARYGQTVPGHSQSGVLREWNSAIWSTALTSVSAILGAALLRLFPDPRPAGSYFSWPRWPVISSASAP